MYHFTYSYLDVVLDCIILYSNHKVPVSFPPLQTILYSPANLKVFLLLTERSALHCDTQCEGNDWQTGRQAGGHRLVCMLPLEIVMATVPTQNRDFTHYNSPIFCGNHRQIVKCEWSHIDLCVVYLTILLWWLLMTNSGSGERSPSVIGFVKCTYYEQMFVALLHCKTEV